MLSTVFIDMDGTIIKHQETEDQMLERDPEILPGVLEAFRYWRDYGVKVYITSARHDGWYEKGNISAYDRTEEQLEEIGIHRGLYEGLILGVGAGVRFIINDDKPHMAETCKAFTIPRNGGLGQFLP